MAKCVASLLINFQVHVCPLGHLWDDIRPTVPFSLSLAKLNQRYTYAEEGYSKMEKFIVWWILFSYDNPNDPLDG